MSPQLRPLSILQHLIVWFGCLLLTGCFQPEGEHFVPLAKPQLAGVEINLASVATPLYIYQPTRVSYRIDQGNFQLIKIEGFLDGEPLYDESNPTVIMVDPADFSNGTHTLTVTATFITNSGTLASKLGQETDQFSSDFEVITDIASPDPILIETIEPRDGTLYVGWETPEKTNFFNYRVTRFLRIGDTWQEEYRTTPWLLDPHQNGFTDSLYTGGEIRYRVDIIGHTFSTEGILAEAQFAAIQPVIEQTGINTLNISWAPSPIFKNIREISLGMYNEASVSYQPGTPVTYNRTVPFGNSYLQYAGVFGKYSNYTSTVYIKLFIGEELTFENLGSNYYYAFHHYGEQELIANASSRPTEIMLVESQTHTIKKRVNLNPYYESATNDWAVEHAEFGMTPDGNNFYLFTGDEVFRFNKELDFGEEIDFTSVNPGLTQFAYNLRLSNNSIACYNFWPGTIGIFDLENGVRIAHGLSDAGMPFNISPDGSYFFYNNRLYDIRSGGMVELAILDNAGAIAADVAFNNTSDKLYLTFRSGKIKIIDVNSLSVQLQFDAPAQIIERILVDPVSGRYAVTTSLSSGLNELVVYEPESQTIVKKVLASGTLHLYDNVIYSEGRFALPL